MTREESLAYIHEWLKDEYALDSKDREALDMAIKALEQEPCEDCISRETARRIVDSGRTRQQMIDMILATPPVTSQPKTGHWILTDDDFVYCSECEDSYYQIPIDASWYYCPHCGARMFEP